MSGGLAGGQEKEGLSPPHTGLPLDWRQGLMGLFSQHHVARVCLAAVGWAQPTSPVSPWGGLCDETLTQRLHGLLDSRVLCKAGRHGQGPWGWTASGAARTRCPWTMTAILCLAFLACEMRITVTPTSQNCGEE